MNPEQAYQELIRLSREETLLASCIDVLEWDEEINLPRKAVSHRSDQLAFLAGMLHDRSTSPRYDELLSILEASALMSNAEGRMRAEGRSPRMETAISAVRTGWR